MKRKEIQKRVIEQLKNSDKFLVMTINTDSALAIGMRIDDEDLEMMFSHLFKQQPEFIHDALNAIAELALEYPEIESQLKALSDVKEMLQDIEDETLN